MRTRNRSYDLMPLDLDQAISPSPLPKAAGSLAADIAFQLIDDELLL